MEKNLTYLQSFCCMRFFLENYYKDTKSGDVAVVLSDTQFFSDGKTADPAAWEDWMDSIQDIKGLERFSKYGAPKEYADQSLTYLQAYKSMRRYLELYYERTRSNDLASILIDTQFKSDGNTVKPSAWTDWINCVDKVLKEEDNEIHH